MSSDSLLKFFNKEKTNRGYYILLKKLFQEMKTTEYTFQKLNKFKLLLNKKLEKILNNNEIKNEIIISLIFNVLKKSYYLIGKEKIKSNISLNEQVFDHKFIRKNLSSPLLNLHSLTEVSENVNNIGISDDSLVEVSLNLAFKFLMIPRNNDNRKFDKIQRTEEDQKDKGEKIFFLLSKNNNTQKHVSFRRDEISINCINFIFKFIEEPINYEDNYKEIKTVS